MIHLVNDMDPRTLEAIQAFALHGEGSEKFEYVASGKNADVFKYEDYAVKKMFDDARYENDGFLLKQLNQKDSIYYPKLYAFEEGKFMVSELINGQTVYNIDGKNGDLIREYRTEIYKAEEHAFEMGLIPDDVHLNNMMLDENGQLKIIDVGQFSPVGHETLQMGLFSFFSSSNHKYKKRKKFFTSSSSRRYQSHGRVYHSTSSFGNRRHRRRHGRVYTSMSSSS